MYNPILNRWVVFWEAVGGGFEQNVYSMCSKRKPADFYFGAGQLWTIYVAYLCDSTRSE